MTASAAPATTPATTAPSIVLPRLGVTDFVIAGITGVAAFLLYFNTLAPGLLIGDSGEFQFAAWLGGFAHPTGYPLYLLLGYLWTHLIRAGEPAWRMNLFSAVWGGLAIGLVYLLTRQTIRIAANPPGLTAWLQRIAALFAAMLLAVSPTFWSQAVITEVYTMHAALVAAIFLGLISWKARGASSEAYRILYVTAFLYGLGLAHHRSTLLLLPAIVVFLWQSRSWSGSWRRRFGGLALGLLLVALPLLLYALIPLRGPQMPYADVIIAPNQIIQLYRPTVGWFVQHITGSGFSSAFHTPAQPLDRIMQSLTWLVAEMSWPGILLGVIGAVWLFFRSRALLTLTGLAFLTLFGFNLLYSIGDIRVFYIPIYLIWAVWAGLGVSAFAWLLSSRGADEPLRRGLAALLCGSLLALPVLLYSQRLPQLDQSRNTHAAQFWQDTLAKPIPQGAILISNDRDEMTPLWYLQYVKNQRPDLTGLFPLIDTGPEWSNVGQVIDSARRSGRPVFLIKPMAGLDIKYRTESADSLVEIIGPAVTRPPDKAQTISYDDTVRLIGYDIQPALAGPSSPMDVTLYWQPQRRIRPDLTTFVHLVNADGKVVGQSDHRPGGDYYPTNLWQPGELLRDVHSLTLADDLGPPPYGLEVGLYTANPELTHLGQPQVIGYTGAARASDPLPNDLPPGESFTLSDELALLGHRVRQENNVLDLQLFWQALRIPDHDYTVFLHILDETGSIIAQQDRQPTGGETPTGSWPAGLVVSDAVTIRLPDNMQPGAYRIVAGMYDAASGARLPVFDNQGRPASDFITLGIFSWPPES